MILPNLITIGAMKSGTSSLHNYLGRHPEISMSRPKELNFFANDPERPTERDLDWYAGQFDPRTPVRGESSVNYTKYPQFNGVPARMHAAVPHARLIYLLRDPIDRIVSHYLHLYTGHKEHRSIDEAVLSSKYVATSQYALQLEQYLSYYPLSQILVLTAEELGAQPIETMQRIFRWLGVEDSFTHASFSHRYHTSAKKKRPTEVGFTIARMMGPKGVQRLRRRRLNSIFMREIPRPQLQPDTIRQLAELIGPDTERLREVTGAKFDNWAI